MPHILELYAQNRESAFFVLLGANKMEPSDLLYRYIHQKGWCGILVEPQSDAFAALQHSLKHLSGLIFEQVAISDVDGQKPFYYIDPNSGDAPKWADQLSSLEARVPESILNTYPKAKLTKIAINCLTISSLLIKYQVKKLDALFIDTEGHDFIILRHFDFARWQPELIVYEHCHLSTADRKAAILLLRQHQYAIYPTAFNTVAFKDELLARPYQDHLI